MDPPLGFLVLSLFHLMNATPCYEPPVPDNSYLMFAADSTGIAPYEPGTSAEYKCNAEFIRIGDTGTDCNATGQWDSPPPTCVTNLVSQVRIQTRHSLSRNATDGNIQTCDEWPANADEVVVDLRGSHVIHSIHIFGDLSSDILVQLAGDHGSRSCERESSQENLRIFTCGEPAIGSVVIVQSVPPSKQMRVCEIQVLSHDNPSPWQCGGAGFPTLRPLGVHKGHCYYASTVAQSWSGAHSDCKRYGGHLLSEPTTADHTFLQDMLDTSRLDPQTSQRPSTFWIDLSSSSDNSAWLWSTGFPLLSSFWAMPTMDSPRQVGGAADAGEGLAVAMSKTYGWNWIPAAKNDWNYYVCKSDVLFCASPGVPANGGLMISNQDHGPGTLAYYYCRYGFMVDGEETRKCLANGTWSGSVPSCLPVRCGSPNWLENSEILFLNHSTTYGSVIGYACRPGYARHGPETRLCEANGLWSGQAPTCHPVTCAAPRNISHGRWTVIQKSINDLEYGLDTLVEYQCDQNRGLIGEARLRCSEESSWSDLPPICADAETLRNAIMGRNSHVALQESFLGDEDTGPEDFMGTIIGILVTALLVVVLVVLWTQRSKLLPEDMLKPPSQKRSDSSSPSSDMLYAVSGTISSDYSRPPTVSEHIYQAIDGAADYQQRQEISIIVDEDHSVRKSEALALRYPVIRPPLSNNSPAPSDPTPNYNSSDYAAYGTYGKKSQRPKYAPPPRPRIGVGEETSPQHLTVYHHEQRSVTPDSQIFGGFTDDEDDQETAGPVVRSERIYEEVYQSTSTPDGRTLVRKHDAQPIYPDETLTEL